MRGPEGVFMDLVTNPQDVKEFVERIGDYMIEIGKRKISMSPWVKSGIRCKKYR
jgi:hypothetical protein